MKNTLLIIDPQNDFCDLEKSSLPVTGSTNDLERVISFIKNNSLSEIVVTLDSHNILDIAHPTFWLGGDDKHPSPFTLITEEDILEGKWNPYKIELKEYCLNYVRELSNKGKYNLIIWPEHCIEGTWGWNIYAPLEEALKEWEASSGNNVVYVKKGLNPLTEHYSAIKAEVEISEDEHTLENQFLVNKLGESDKIFVAGEALTHCVYSTVKDLANSLRNKEFNSKVILLENASSPVAGFENKVEGILLEFKNDGVETLTII